MAEGRKLLSREENLIVGIHRLPKLALLACLLLAFPAAGRAQELYTYSLGLLGTMGGSPDAEPGNSLTNTGFQLNALMVTEPRTLVGFRAGKLALDDDGLFNDLTDAELTYATIGGEYRAKQTYFESGLFVGIGGYRLEGNSLLGSEKNSSWGVNVGFTSEFFITRRVGVLLELSGHYADFDDVQFFVMGHGGIAIHF